MTTSIKRNPRPTNVKNRFDSESLGLSYSVNFDSYPQSSDIELDQDKYIYRGLKGIGRDFSLWLYGSSSPFADLEFYFGAASNTQGVFYIFQPDSSSEKIYVYVNQLRASVEGTVELNVANTFSIALVNPSIAIENFNSYPGRESISGIFKVPRFSLYSIDKHNSKQSWLSAGTDKTPAFVADLSFVGKQAGDFSLSLEGVRLGPAILGYEASSTGSLSISFSSTTNSISLSGSIAFEQFTATFLSSINLTTGSLDSISFGLRSGERIDFTSDIGFTLGNARFTYKNLDTTSDQTRRLFMLEAGDIKFHLGEFDFSVGGDLYVALSSANNTPSLQLERATLTLEDTLKLPFGALVLEVGKGSKLQINSSHNGELGVSISGAVSLLDSTSSAPLLGFTVSNDNPVSWGTTGFKLQGRFDLPSIAAGPFQIGDDAHLEFKEGEIIFDPDLYIDSKLYSALLQPIAEPLNQVITPILNPLLDLMDTEVPLPAGLGSTLSPEWWWPQQLKDARSTVDNIIGNTSRVLAALFEGSVDPLTKSVRKDRWFDGKLQIVDILDFFLDKLWLLSRTGAAKSLADSLGIDSSLIEALQKMPQPQFATQLNRLAIIQDIVKMLQASSAGLNTSQLNFDQLVVRIPTSQPLDTRQLDSIEQQASSLVQQGKGLLADLVNFSDQLRPESRSEIDNPSIAIKVDPFVEFPFIKDLMGTFNAISKNKPFDLIEVGLFTDIRFSFAYSQIIDLLPIIGFPLPLTLGFDSRLNLKLNPVFGLSTTSSALQTFVKDAFGELSKVDSLLETPESLAKVLAKVPALLFPSSFSQSAKDNSDPYGLYFTHPKDKPLLRLNPEFRLNAGIDYRLLGLRLYSGLGADFDVSIAGKVGNKNQRLYMDDFYHVLKPLLEAGSSNNQSSVAQSTAFITASLASLQRLSSLFDYQLQAYIPWGVEPKLPVLGWVKDLPYITGRLTLPAVRVGSKNVALAGPIQNASVHFDRRRYQDGTFLAPGNLIYDSSEEFQEVLAHTDATGAFHLPLESDYDDVNRDGIVDYKDGLVVVSTSTDNDSFHLFDSITGLDLQHPLIGLPGGNASILTTLKYMLLLRWSPNSRVVTSDSNELLSPELINKLAKIFFDAPTGLLDDDFNPYRALQGDLDQQKEAVRTLRFSYEQMFLLRTVATMLATLKLDYSDPLLWGINDRSLDPDIIDSPSVVSTSAWAYTLLHLFGYVSVGRESSPFLSAADKFDLANTSHLYKFFSRVISLYPTHDLWQRASVGSDDELQGFKNHFLMSVRPPSELPLELSLRNQYISDFRASASIVDVSVDEFYKGILSQMAHGFADLILTFRQQFDEAVRLSDNLQSNGVELLIPAIAGLKRQTIDFILPQLVAKAFDPDIDDSKFSRWIHEAVSRPLMVDAIEREHSFVIGYAEQPLEIRGSKVVIKFKLLPFLDASNDGSLRQTSQPVVAPDYGLSVRYQLGGNARNGIDYHLSDPLLDGKGVELPLLRFAPGSSEAEVEFLLNPASLDSVIPLTLQFQLLNADSGFVVMPESSVLNLSLSKNSFSTAVGPRSGFVTSALAQSGLTVERSNSGNVYFLAPQLIEDVLPHISSFDPEIDSILVDPIALREVRKRRFVMPDQQDELTAQWERQLELSDQHLAVVAGVLIDRLTTTPLATVSYLAADGHEIAWSQIEGGESVRFASSSPVVIDLGGFVFSPSTSLALEFPSTVTALPWQAATTLLLADRDGAHPIAIANLSGAASGYPIGYSPSQVAHVRLPHLDESQVSRLMIQPFDGRTRQISPDLIELSVQQSDQYFPNRLDLMLPDGSLWARLVSADPDQLPSIDSSKLHIASTPGIGSTNQQVLLELSVPVDEQIADTRFAYEWSRDSGGTWEFIEPRHVVGEGVYLFRGREALPDGSVLLTDQVELAVDPEGRVISKADQPQQPNVWRNRSDDFDLIPLVFGADEMLALRLDRLGSSLSSQQRALRVDFELYREATLDNRFSMALVRQSDGQLIDPLTGQSQGSLHQLATRLDEGEVDNLLWFEGRESSTVHHVFNLPIAANLDLTDLALVPLLHVPGSPSQLFSSGPAFNADGLQHVLPLGHGRFGLEDTLHAGDADVDDLVVGVLAMNIIAVA